MRNKPIKTDREVQKSHDLLPLDWLCRSFPFHLARCERKKSKNGAFPRRRLLIINDGSLPKMTFCARILPARRGYWKTNHADCGESQIREYFSARYCLDFRMAGDACAGRGKGGQDLMQTKLSQLAGEDQSSDDLIRQIYSELKQMARRRMALERNGVTLGTTALVHEAWMRLEKSAPSQWRDRPQFFAAAAEAMRRILVEAARRRMAAKRGRGEAALPLDGIDIAPPADDERLLEVHEALEELEREDPFKAGIVKMRFFSGMENEEISALLEVSEKTVRRHWEVAKVWLYRALSGGN